MTVMARQESHRADLSRRNKAGERPVSARAIREHEFAEFLVWADRGVLGIEITALCNEEPRATAGQLGNVIHASERRYRSVKEATPVDVVVAFSPRAEQIHNREPSAALLEVVAARQKADVVVPEIANGAWQLNNATVQSSDQIFESGRRNGGALSSELLRDCRAKMARRCKCGGQFGPDLSKAGDPHFAAWVRGESTVHSGKKPICTVRFEVRQG
jgi:hypothetical protein